MSIKLLITGGTLDKRYLERTGAMGFTQTCVVEMLNQGRCMLETRSEVVFLKDSLAIGAQDRALILRKCQQASEQQILITHGTDTLVETAKLLGRSVTDKTVVVFGAMIPRAVASSDAMFNLGVAIGALQMLPAGVYVAMNGQVFGWDSVKKDAQQGIFVAT